jgi:predicted RNA-binding protein associated with RNAse of E/G family
MFKLSINNRLYLFKISKKNYKVEKLKGKRGVTLQKYVDIIDYRAITCMT